MKEYTVTRNGYNIETFNNKEDVEKSIADALSNYKHLRPKEIFRTEGTINNKKVEIIIYQYYTLYKEMFMIEEI